MQKTNAGLSGLIIVVAVIGACILRLFQLLQNSASDLINYIIYGLVLSVSSVMLISSVRKAADFTVNTKSRSIANASLAASAGMFVYFVYQCYFCFDYFKNTEYIEYAYLIMSAMSGLSALLSCLYLLCIRSAAGGSNIDIKRLRLLHFSLILFCSIRLITLTMEMIDVRTNVNSGLELMLLISVIVMWFGYIYLSDTTARGGSIAFSVGSVTSFCISVIYFLSALSEIILSGGNVLPTLLVMPICYLTVGAFSITLFYRSRG